jgi:hypothetical protein
VKPSVLVTLIALGAVSCDHAERPSRAAPPVSREPSAEAPSPGTRLAWRGKKAFLLGANVPWNVWACDFGCGARGGVSGARDLLMERFRSARDNGIRLLRWWVFEDDRDPRPIRRDASGAPTLLDPEVYVDFDAALDIAKALDIAYVFVLFSSPSALPRSWLEDPVHRERLVQALVPLFERYAGSEHILAWETFNEPEWDIWHKKVALEPVQALVTDVVRAVHAHAKSYASVGAATLAGLPLWRRTGVDYADAHWYDPMKGDACAVCTDVAAVRARYALDAPLVLGEMYAGPDVDALGRLEELYAKGYAGAWAWSLLSERTKDRMSIDLAAVRTFKSRHDDVGP